MLPFLTKKEGSNSEPAQNIKRESDNEGSSAIEAIKKALHQAKESINAALELLGDQ